MSESRKSPRPKGPRPAGKPASPRKSGSGSGWSTSKPGGKPSGKPGRKDGDERRSGAPKGPRKGPGPQASKGPGKPARRDDRRDDRRDASRDDRREAPREKKAPRERVDDFDFDLADTQPAAFPKPARSAAGAASRPARPERPARAPREAQPTEAPEEGKSVTAGRNAVRELLESAPRRVDAIYVRKGRREAKMQEIVSLADGNRVKVQFVDDAFLRRLFPGTHQGVVAVTAAVEYAELDALIAAVAGAPLPVLLALDKVQDPGNLGAVARTAWALGAAGIIVPRHGGAYIGGGAMRASAGALHHLPVARVTNMSQALDACAEAGLSILCADAAGENLYQAQIRLPAVLVLGGEEKGVRHGVAKHCEQRLAIPFRRSFDSLNVAQAAAICLARLGQP